MDFLGAALGISTCIPTLNVSLGDWYPLRLNSLDMLLIEDIPDVITACCVLHRFILDRKTDDDVVLEDGDDGDLEEGAEDVNPVGPVNVHGEEKRTIANMLV